MLFLTLTFALLATSSGANLNWWQTAVFYQIYPRSFKDSNNDGKGDLQGIIQKLDHFTETGVSAIWLSPIYKSPQVDQGYDIQDFKDIDPDYGTFDEFNELVEKAHARGLKVILDFVPNHTSDQHQWFNASVHNVEEYRDYYMWVNAEIDENGQRKPPNNWLSVFKNSAWTWSEERQQYYLHQFESVQPDLNYSNPAVVDAIKDVLKFWLDHGVDGFRIDSIPNLFEDELLRDEPRSYTPGYNATDYEYLEHIFTKDQDRTYDMLYQWRELVDEYTRNNGGDQRLVLMTEAYTEVNKTMYYYGLPDGSRRGSHFTFNFYMILDLNGNSTAVDILNALNKFLKALPEIYIPNWVLGNHDNHRVATRFGPGNVDGFNMMMAVLPGVGVTYNGEEIGQEDGEVTFEQGQDTSARDPNTFAELSRDFERTPYQWDNSTNAGFNDGAETWLPVSKKYQDTNLEKEKSGISHYNVYKGLMKLRSSDELMIGSVDIAAVHEDVLVIKRSYQGRSLVMVFNRGDQRVTVNVSNYISKENSINITSINSRKNLHDPVDPMALTLDQHESLIVNSK